jgi:hypothetical protein
VIVDGDAPKLGMASDIPTGPDMKASLARIVDQAGGRDEAENEYYEVAADPLHLQNERARRRFRGSYFRRLRRLQGRSRDVGLDDG